jgi:NAD(P)H-flavin reductase
MDYETYPSCNLDARRQTLAGLDNVYLPQQAIVRKITRENALVNTYELTLLDEMANQRFSSQPGQFMMVSMPHLGEAPISFSSCSYLRDGFALTIRNSGSLTRAVHTLRVGDTIGVRGPYGNTFPLDECRGKNLFFIAGGIGLAPLRPVIEYYLRRSGESGRLVLLYGSKSPDEFCFSGEFATWQEQGLDCHLTVDQAATGWDGRVGLVTTLLDGITLGPNDRALVCGPGIMIRFVLAQLQSMGMEAQNIITTLERHMKCGMGTCGHCHSGDKLVCVDGPVFRADEIPEPDNP